MYGAECWAVKGQQKYKLNVVEMRMLHKMSELTRQDINQNELMHWAISWSITDSYRKDSIVSP